MFGVYVNDPFAFSVTVPFAGSLTLTAVSGSPFASVSLARTPGALTVSGVSFVAVYASSAATGATPA